MYPMDTLKTHVQVRSLYRISLVCYDIGSFAPFPFISLMCCELNPTIGYYDIWELLITFAPTALFLPTWHFRFRYPSALIFSLRILNLVRSLRQVREARGLFGH